VRAEEQFQDPVLAYDRLARAYAKIADKRKLYLAGVEREILARIPRESQSLLDIGAGDGSRALRLASAAGVSRIVLLEPSTQMLSARTEGVEIWRCRAEDLTNQPSGEKFDVTICLWNVLGHISGSAKVRRCAAFSSGFRKMAVFSWTSTIVTMRAHTESFRPWLACCMTLCFLARRTAMSRRVGNLGPNASAPMATCSHREIVQLAESAGLKMEERIVIDYGDGRVRRSPFQGNLLYVFRRRA
jgi:hypothetical protein